MGEKEWIKKTQKWKKKPYIYTKKKSDEKKRKKKYKEKNKKKGKKTEKTDPRKVFVICICKCLIGRVYYPEKA